MAVRRSDEIMENSKAFAKELQGLMLQKKAIDEEIKELKDNYKEDGVAVGVVTKALNKIKAAQKQSEAESMEESIIMEGLEADDDIMSNIATLIL